jgi:hypothetical protein
MLTEKLFFLSGLELMDSEGNFTWEW